MFESGEQLIDNLFCPKPKCCLLLVQVCTWREPYWNFPPVVCICVGYSGHEQQSLTGARTVRGG